jgi:molecular chaperone DnaK
VPLGAPQIETSLEGPSAGIENSSGLNSAEVEKMKRDAELHADEDGRRRDLIDEKNKAGRVAQTHESGTVVR